MSSAGRPGPRPVEGPGAAPCWDGGAFPQRGLAPGVTFLLSLKCDLLLLIGAF